MENDYDPLVEDLEDDDDGYQDEDEDKDKPYDVNKDTDLGEPEDQEQDAFQRRLDKFEISVECAPPIDSTIVEIVGENTTPQTQSQGQEQLNTGGGVGVKAPAKRKGRGPTTSFKKPTGPMVLEYDKRGRPTGQWIRKYANQVGICSRKIPITLCWKQVPPGLIQTFWDDTRASVLFKCTFTCITNNFT